MKILSLALILMVLAFNAGAWTSDPTQPAVTRAITDIQGSSVPRAQAIYDEMATLITTPPVSAQIQQLLADAQTASGQLSSTITVNDLATAAQSLDRATNAMATIVSAHTELMNSDIPVRLKAIVASEEEISLGIAALLPPKMRVPKFAWTQASHHPLFHPDGGP